MIKTFEDLDVWKRSCQLAVGTYTALHQSKDYGLRDQMQRAAVSIASNIAEGSDRGTTAEFVRFLRIAKASCAELRTQLYIAQRIRKETNQPSLEKGAELIQETKEISAMLQSLINSLQSKQASK